MDTHANSPECTSNDLHPMLEESSVTVPGHIKSPEESVYSSSDSKMAANENGSLTNDKECTDTTDWRHIDTS